MSSFPGQRIIWVRIWLYFTAYIRKGQPSLPILHRNRFPRFLKFCRATGYFPKTGLPRPVLCGQFGQLTPRRTAGPGPARVLVHWGETWSHPRGTLGRCLKGSEINIQSICNRQNRFPRKFPFYPPAFKLKPEYLHSAPLQGAEIHVKYRLTKST